MTELKVGDEVDFNFGKDKNLHGTIKELLTGICIIESDSGLTYHVTYSRIGKEANAKKTKLKKTSNLIET